MPGCSFRNRDSQTSDLLCAVRVRLIAPGHTPGSVIIFVTLQNGTRYAFVGDLVWQLEGITQREERPWITRRKADTDAEGTRENLLRMVALKERLPDLVIIPAHDMRAFNQLPSLSRASSEGD